MRAGSVKQGRRIGIRRRWGRGSVASTGEGEGEGEEETWTEAARHGAG